MKIALNVFPLTRPRTGIGIYTEQLSRHLLEIDRANEYLFYYGKYFSRKLVISGDRPGRKIEGGEGGSFPGKARCRQILKDIYFPAVTALRRCQLYHELYSYPLPFHGKTVLTVHDLSPLLFPGAHPRERAGLWKSEFPGRLRRADRIIAISNNTKRDLVRLCGVDPGKIEVVYYGCRRIFRPMERHEVEHALRKMEIDFPYVLYVGAIEPRKNVLLLVDAFRRLKKEKAIPHKLVLGGPLAWKSEGILRGMDESEIPYYIRGEGSKEDLEKAEVVITGYIPNELLPPLMNGAALFVFPSLYEGFGLPPLEAMACGTPVITSDSSSLPEVVGDAGILVPPDDRERLVSEMKRVLSDEDLRRDLGERGTMQAARFSWKACAEEVLRIYGEVAEE